MNPIDIIRNNKKIIFLTILLAILLPLYFFVKGDETIQVENKQVIAPDYMPILNSIEAKSFFVYDILKSVSILNKDEHKILPLASITKLMSGFVALETLPDTTIITITKEDIQMEGDSGLNVGEKWKLKDLLDFTLMVSSNDGMHAITRTLNYFEAVNNKDTIKLMNEKAKELGLNDTIFINETGLDVNENMSGAYSSAYDVSQLFSAIMRDKPNLISNTYKQKEDFVSESGVKHTAINTNTSVNQISGLMASKTGFTDLAGGNLTVIFDAGFMHPVVIVVLGSSVDGRFSDVIKLENITLEKFSE